MQHILATANNLYNTPLGKTWRDFSFLPSDQADFSN